MDETAHSLMKDTKATSVSIGIVINGMQYSRHYGEIDKGKGNIATNETLFEIASLTKVLTGTLMAKAVLDGKITLNDDIRNYMPGSYPNLEYHGRPITIKDLVSFRAGFSKDLPDRSTIFKTGNDSIPFLLKKMEEGYTKGQFFKELRQLKLDTLPGTVYRYSNSSVELSAFILENVYHKQYEQLLNDYLLKPLKLTRTKLYPPKDEIIANGYNGDVRMPSMPNSLWGASGYLKSSMRDLLKLLAFELDNENPLVRESRRNLLNSQGYWNGYFWDQVGAGNDGLHSSKHGGAFGTQNLFTVYPELNMGISILVNQSRQNTAPLLHEARNNLIDELKPFGKKSIGRAIIKKSPNNIDSAIAYYHYLKKNNIHEYNFSDEAQLNSLGYKLISKGDFDSAIKVFKLMVSEFPDSGNAYDSLGEAYFNKKDYEMARKSYKRSLELSPGNTNAKNMLEKIGGAIK